MQSPWNIHPSQVEPLLSFIKEANTKVLSKVKLIRPGPDGGWAAIKMADGEDGKIYANEIKLTIFADEPSYIEEVSTIIELWTEALLKHSELVCLSTAINDPIGYTHQPEYWGTLVYSYVPIKLPSIN